MELIHAIVYGIIQGVTAYLPISSDAHIRLVQSFLHWDKDESPVFVAYTAVIQLGPTLAVILYYRKVIAKALKRWFQTVIGNRPPRDAKLAWGVFWGTIPIIVLGLLLQKPIETHFRSLYYVAGSLIAIAFVMFYGDKIQKEGRDVNDVEVKDGLIVGLWQCLALIPGASRSGSTITGSLFQGFKRESAAEFAFLLGIPSFTAAGVYEGLKYHQELHALLQPLAISFVISFVVAYACLAWFLHFLQKKGVGPFVIYRIVLGIVILGLVFGGVLEPNAGAKPLADEGGKTSMLSTAERR
ncbi:MAG TPA: undecaprenyl-diphosphatase UppP [Fimbriimonas sp.]|nr:undecaprenyl-diphosphatase UppP [Fimbriimonas sp.]